MRRKGKGKGARKPTYGAATRLARLICDLASTPWGRSFEAITDELGITERTLLRYVHVCSRELLDRDGRPLLEVRRQGERRVLQLSREARAADATAWEAACLHFLLRQASFLEGTALHEIADCLWHRTWEGLSASYREQFSNLDRKLFALPESRGAYAAGHVHVDRVLRALIYQRRLRIAHEQNDGEVGTDEIDPYTLATFRGRLCVFGRRHPGEEILVVPVERIRSLERLADADGAAVRFRYPRGYDPADLADALVEAVGSSENSDGRGNDGTPGGPAGLTRRGPRRASRVPRNGRRARLFGRAG